MGKHGDCARCGDELGDRFYQDVPKEGDLCLPCHVGWVEEIREAYRKHVLHDTGPDGDESVELNNYTVWKREVYRASFHVEATNPREAVQIVLAGGGEADDSELDGELDPASWDVDDANGNRVTEGERKV